MDIQELPKTLEAEIAELERKLAARKEAALGGDNKEEKELFREVLKEHVESAKEVVHEAKTDQPAFSSSTPASSSHDYAAQTKGKADEIREKEHREQIEALVDIALTKGVLDAVAVARHLGNPHLLDDFHDMLVDEYYDKLLQARKLT